MALSNTAQNIMIPQSIEAEQAVLGCIMTNNEIFGEILEVFSENYRIFYDLTHQKIFEVFVTLNREKKPIDIITVIDRLTINGQLDEVGGHEYLVNLAESASIGGNAIYYAQIIQEKFTLRQLIKAGNKIIENSFKSNNVDEVLDEAQQSIFAIGAKRSNNSLMRIDEITTPVWKQIEERYENQGSLLGTSSGFIDLDNMTAGLQKSDLVIVAARPSMGKCLGKGTKVLMFDGSLKKVEDIKEGDTLMGDDSLPRKVSSIASGIEKMYWVKQNKAIDYRVNESHILSLKRSRNEGKFKKGEVLNISIKDYLAKSDKFKTNYKGYKVAVEFAEKELALQPYFLGLWLGDGHSYSSRITTIDNEVIEYLSEYAESLKLKLVKYSQINRTPDYGITKGGIKKTKTDNNIQAELRKLNLLRNKHIPNNYLINSTQNRLNLLAGLLDSDGYYDKNFNCYEIVQKNLQLANQIKFLCDSLGFKVSLKKKNATIKSIGFKTEVYRIRIFGDLDKIPVLIQRKKARPLQSKADWRVTGIQVEYDKEDEYYGFTIDGNHLFLLEDMTVTHNTAFCLNIAEYVGVVEKCPVAVFSLEMSKTQLVNRMICSISGVDSQRIRTGNLRNEDWDRISHAIGVLSGAQIYIDDTAALTVMDIRTKARKLKTEKKDLGLIVIDYLQLMSGSGKENRTQEISEISRGLKSLARELNVPIIALSQLSRGVEARTDKRPMLSDLRESGAIEQDADMVVFLYRHEYYEPNDTSRSGECEVIIAKQRNGPVGTVKLSFHGATTRFNNYAKE